MKKVSQFILILFVFCIFCVNVEALFYCEVSGYIIGYDETGDIKNIRIEATNEEIKPLGMALEMRPLNKEECPTDENAFAYYYGDDFYLREKQQDIIGCLGSPQELCESSEDDYACIWNEVTIGKYKYYYCNVDNLRYVKCGDVFDIPYQVPGIISFAVNALKIATPIILIIVSIIVLLKAIAASNEDEIKKAQKGLVRRVVAAVMVFFVISIVQFVVMTVASNSKEADNVSNCLSCFLNNDCRSSVYYKTNVFGRYICSYINSGKRFDCN